MNNKKIFLFSLQIAIISCGLSVSISQFFLGVTFVLFLFEKERRRRFEPSIFFWMTLLFFVNYLLSFTINFFYFQHPLSEILIKLKQSEFKDILLFFAFFLSSTLDETERLEFKKYLFRLMIVMTVLGFFSIFSIYRFSYLINSLFREVSTWKYQHSYGKIAGIDIFLPIGLMNTHLTYGGILSFFTPFVFFLTINKITQNKNKYHRFLIILLSLIYFIVVLLNNARSSIMGSFVSIFFGVLLYIYVKKEYNLKIIIKYFFLSVLILIFIMIPLSFTAPFKKTVLPLLGSQKHTDSGRTFIWDSTFNLIQENPIIGIGPGNYSTEIDRVRHNRSEKNSELLFFYEVTQKGHSHNDIFHIMAISGIPNTIVYIILFFLICRRMIEISEFNEDISIYLGLMGFFFAGALQCYFQDDEVVILFWYIAGFLFGNFRSLKKMNPT